jgi:hypothetical protein
MDKRNEDNIIISHNTNRAVTYFSQDVSIVLGGALLEKIFFVCMGCFFTSTS